MFGAEGKIFGRMIVGVIRQAQRDRIHFQRVGELIERAFQRISSGTFARCAHECRGGDVNRVNYFLYANGRTLVHDGGRTCAARFGIVADWRGERVGDVLHRLQFSIAGGDQRNRLRCRRAMARPRKHALARHVHLHRHARGFRAHDREENVRPDCAFASERAADKRTNDANIFNFETVSARD